MIRRALPILLAAAMALPGCGKKNDELSESEEIKNLWTADDRRVNEVLNQAQKLKDAGQAQEALPLYLQAMQMYESTEASKFSFNWGLWAQMCVGEAYESQGKFDDAIGAYRKISARFVGGSPDDTWAIEAHKKIVSCYRAKKQEKLALEELRKIIAADERIVATSPADPAVAWAALEIGWCYAQMREWRRAVAAYEKAKENYPQGSWAGQADLGIAECYERQGNKRKAKEILERVIQQYPTDWAEQAKRRLAELEGKPASRAAAPGAERRAAQPPQGGGN